MKYKKYPQQTGFTLMELLMTVVIASILVSLAGPNFRTLIQNNKQVAHTNEFVTSMHLARSESAKRGEQVSVIAANTSDAGNEWGPGWSVQVTASGENLRTAIDLTDSITLNSGGGVAVYRYEPDGSLSLGANDTLDVCDSSRSGEARRRVSLAPNGRVSLDTSGACP